jgi:hypothetical protein
LGNIPLHIFAYLEYFFLLGHIAYGFGRCISASIPDENTQEVLVLTDSWGVLGAVGKAKFIGWGWVGGWLEFFSILTNLRERAEPTKILNEPILGKCNNRRTCLFFFFAVLGLNSGPHTY